MLKVPVAESVGMVLCHDITRIIPGRKKERAFRKGQLITSGDIPKLLDLGKAHIYVWEPANDLVHEDEAALRLARLAAGPGLIWNEPSQGKVSLRAAHDGLLKVRGGRLNRLNSLDGVVLATAHNNRVVFKGQIVAGTRVIPLTIQRHILEEADEICSGPEPLLSVKSFQPLRVGIVTTGSEVYTGRIEDGFYSVVREKAESFGALMHGHVIVPDDPNWIAAEIRRMIGEGVELVIVTGGMSVDPDDVTPTGIKAAGADVVSYGAPVLPGSMFMLAYLGDVPVCGLPGCVMFNKTTVFDLVLPRVFAGERLSKADIVALGQGGLCEECEVCRYPACSFGKAAEI
ncbi:molybdopterin-binding protein [Pelotomaculum terephthalicicum JT]|uniref:molybdopterin-binding protein n=1 Tax=Pelotomaculum TaxID=191373 RepID=UPI0009D57FCF|nr:MULTISPECIES: molybdopterin-binding protein [Pelotomaculum]MCG9966607.1 molybdopterin-binding protein [Pelotomaculum terephthalicicum JT]OPX92293.1 MAG: bifunctional molybdenum cofactor biosynthesis protein MoaC/MogA [Pelotomaculum sp. PtaB.Bin117]OPY63546.1 MAG: bifunctional molybdenum cofactor biosynthesis protein MoaC/MogA [Pelotomaculum sp. PtaU1.Bin065]